MTNRFILVSPVKRQAIVSGQLIGEVTSSPRIRLACAYYIVVTIAIASFLSQNCVFK